MIIIILKLIGLRKMIDLLKGKVVLFHAYYEE